MSLTTRRLPPVSLFAALLLVSCSGGEGKPEPGPFQAGAARVRMPVPMGIGTAGFNGIGVASQRSRYSMLFPATQNVLGHPDVKAVVLSRGDGFEVVFLRADLVAITERLRAAVVDEVKKRTGRDVSQSLVFGATHTHSGPGRFIDGSFFEVVGDSFHAPYVERLVGAMGQAIEEAYADLAPAEVGHVVASAPEAHADRRCEDLETYTNDAFPLLVVKREGKVRAVVGSYATHGTLFGIDELFLTQDVNGATEEHIENAFDHDVEVVVFNAWGADMAPGTPSAPPMTLSPGPGAHARADLIGTYLAGIVKGAVEKVVTTATPDIGARTYRYEMNRTALGYAEGVFPYEYGGVYCGGEPSCDELRVISDQHRRCLSIPEEDPQVMQGGTVVGRVGGLHFVTWSGEAGTRLAESVHERIAPHGVSDLMFVGYSTSYHGYSLEEEDWWHGGYEASGAMWGPRQGDYMAERIADAVADWKGSKALPFSQPEALRRPAQLESVPEWPTEAGLEVGTVAAEPAETLAPNGVASFSFHASDPWFGIPYAVLERQTDAGWVEVKRPNGAPYDSDTYGFWSSLDVSPGYDSARTMGDRHFTWTVNYLPLRRGTTHAGEAMGTFRFRVRVGTATESVTVTSRAFTIRDDT